MPSEPSRPSFPSLRPRDLPKFPWERMDGWGDAIYAIAATLLVLELKVPHIQHGGLGQALLDQWPRYLIYVMGFLFMAGGWMAARRLSSMCWALDHYGMLLCFLGELPYILMPFAMGVLGDATSNHADFLAAIRLLLVVLFASATAYLALFIYLDRAGLFHRDFDSHVFRAARRTAWAGPIASLIALCLTFVIGSWSLALPALMSILVFLPVDPVRTSHYFGSQIADERAG